MGRRSKRPQRVTAELASAALEQPEVVNYQTYVGTASPYNFNGLVRHYYLRRGPNVADIQVNLLSKRDRDLQSHDIAKRVRQRLLPIAQKYGRSDQSGRGAAGAAGARNAGGGSVRALDQRPASTLARQIRDLWRRTDGVVDVDWYVEDDQPKYRFVVDHEKAALAGISQQEIARDRCRPPSGDCRPGCCIVDSEKEDMPLTMRLDRSARSDLQRLASAERSLGPSGQLVALGELVRDREARRGQEHLSQEPDAGGLRHRRRGGQDGEPGLRHPRAEPGDG